MSFSWPCRVCGHYSPNYYIACEKCGTPKKGSTTMFIKLTVADSRLDLHIAVDQIASYVAYDRYRPHGISWISLKDGNRYQVSQNPDEIAALIANAGQQAKQHAHWTPALGPNTGHGHVYLRPDGVKSRCGGPRLCNDCANDLAELVSGR